MNYFEFLATHSKVETVIGLLAFTIAAVLGFLTYQNSVKLKGFRNIIDSADTQTKSDLAVALLEVMPTYKIPDLNQKQGFEIVKIQLTQRASEFTSKIKTLRLCIYLAAAIMIVITLSTYVKFDQFKSPTKVSTSGDKSPVVTGPDAHIEYHDETNKGNDSTKNQ